MTARAVLVDSNVLIDLLGPDSPGRRWSVDALEREGETSLLVINPIIYAEVSAGFERIEELDAALPADVFHREPLPWPGGFLAARAHMEYRRRPERGDVGFPHWRPRGGGRDGAAHA